MGTTSGCSAYVCFINTYSSLDVKKKSGNNAAQACLLRAMHYSMQILETNKRVTITFWTSKRESGHGPQE